MEENAYAALPHLSASKIRVAIKHNHEQALKVFAKENFDDPHSLGKWLHYFLLEKPEQDILSEPSCPEHLHESICKGRQVISENSDMQEMILSSKREHTYLWEEFLISGPAKARLDILHPQAIWDLKCIRGGSEVRSFEKKMKRLGWQVQAWWYQRAVEKVLDQRLPVGFLVLDTHNWTLRKHVLSELELEKASNLARESMRKLKRWGLL